MVEVVERIFGESVLVLLNIWFILISYFGLEMGILTDIFDVFLSPSR
jgi:hypothetical protein